MDITEFKKIKINGFKRHPWELVRLKMLLFFLKQSKSLFSIVDIGSGDAFLSSGLAHQLPGSTITAFDINYSEEVLRELSVNVPSNVRLTNNFDSLRSISTIDILIFMDVLEHLENPGDLLQKIHDLPGFTKNTTVIITVPAFQKLFSQHDTELGHFKRYTLKTLESLLRFNNLKQIKKGYCFNCLLPVRILQVWYERIKKNKNVPSNGIHNWNKGRIITSFVASAFWIEFKISWYLSCIGIRLPGLTCYSICQLSQ